ncbi:MAG: hypothetical protein IJI97_02675 [Clostridia bacterium]|nr:hypothetical protein [Clostridia bacterium]
MKPDELHEVLAVLLPKREHPDERTVFVKCTAEPDGIAVAGPDGPDGRIDCDVTYQGLWIYRRRRMALIPIDTITEVYAENIPDEDDMI